MKQDLDAESAKDGMDVALCKINLKTLQLDYAGAHRPLYMIVKDTFVELKGNKRSIGGTHYDLENPFENYTYQLAIGDSIYFNTDGLPDQLGGPDGKSKWMSRRIRELVVENKQENMENMKKIIEKQFNSWKSNSRQMDDVLMIGIKF